MKINLKNQTRFALTSHPLVPLCRLSCCARLRSRHTFLTTEFRSLWQERAGTATTSMGQSDDVTCKPRLRAVCLDCGVSPTARSGPRGSWGRVCSTSCEKLSKALIARERVRLCSVSLPAFPHAVRQGKACAICDQSARRRLSPLNWQTLPL